MTPLSPAECAQRARAAAASLDLAAIDRSGPGGAKLLWRDAASEAWLNTWWEPRDTGFHDHDGSCIGVYVIAGRAENEALTIGGPRAVRCYGPGESFSFPGTGSHRMDHDAGAITIHVYSPPIRAIGCYELVDGELRRTPAGPDDPSPASPALTAGLEASAPSSRGG